MGALRTAYPVSRVQIRKIKAYKKDLDFVSGGGQPNIRFGNWKITVSINQLADCTKS
jgi:hypothetical protein